MCVRRYRIGMPSHTHLGHTFCVRRYRIGMPMTQVCDGDVMARCHVDKLTAPFLERGFLLQCLLKHASTLHRPCWDLISLFDDQ